MQTKPIKNRLQQTLSKSGQVIRKNPFASFLVVLVAFLIFTLLNTRSDRQIVREELKNKKKEVRILEKSIERKEIEFKNLLNEIRTNDSLYYSNKPGVDLIPVDSLIRKLSERFNR